MRYTIRKALEKDIECLSIMFHNTVNEINRKDYTQEQIKVWQNRATPERWLELWNSSLVFLVAENGEKQIIGFASFNTNGYIHSMFVHHLHQRKGIATALLRNIEKKVDSSILISDVSITAKSFFEKMGFYVVKQQSVCLEGIALVNYVMNKTLIIGEKNNNRHNVGKDNISTKKFRCN